MSYEMKLLEMSSGVELDNVDLYLKRDMTR